MLRSATLVSTEVESRADFSVIRYAQVWEDADVLVQALDIKPGDICLSIASAGDNALALLTRDPSRVIALDMNPAQLACLELRVAAYRSLDHAGMLELIGSRASARRAELYKTCRDELSDETQNFWDARPEALNSGIGGVGKFERYFELFRTWVLPLAHGRRRVARLLEGGTRETREAFYSREWDTWRWRGLFKVFFSRFVMGRLGRDPSFFRYVEGTVAEHILEHTRHALTALNPAENPYLHWILTGTHGEALPLALRKENFEIIRSRLDRVEWHLASIETYLESHGNAPIHRFNLSDIFEYMSEDAFEKLLERLCAAGAPGGRLVYWNMLAPRSRPTSMADRLRPLDEIARSLHDEDKAFFYRALIVEEIC